MKFTKVQGAGNDFVMVNSFAEVLPADLAKLACAVCHRHFGVGADGLIILGPGSNPETDYQMRIFNADGSEAEMCGNGIRCAAVFARDNGICAKNEQKVLTGAGVIAPAICAAPNGLEEPGTAWVRVDMGYPHLKAKEIPVKLEAEPVLEQPLEVLGKKFKFNAVSMGNPHAVIFVDKIDDELVYKIGAKVETLPLFPAKTNVEFVRVIDKDHLKMRVWERGCGETLACGTGASATAVAAVLTGRTHNKVAVELLGGTLFIEYNEGGKVYMTGPAKTVFQGEYI